MISADSRVTLIDAITPPHGYEFDCGIATTYTLGLDALLTLPVHLSWLAPSTQSSDQIDTIRILEGLSRVIDRLTIFVDEGHIAAPPKVNSLYLLLDPVIQQVSLRSTASSSAKGADTPTFHPKLWLLRFVDQEDPSKVALRLVVLSRNITNDNCWDATLILDGTIGKSVIKSNEPIVDLLKALPGMVTDVKKLEKRDWITKQLTEEVSRCKWDLPAGFDRMEFFVTGIGRRKKDIKKEIHGYESLVIISPFLSENALKIILGNHSSPCNVVSRDDQIALLEIGSGKTSSAPDAVNWFDNYFCIDPDANVDDGRSVDRGLHAKIYAFDKAGRTNIWVGSANCTNAALVAQTNVELMACLSGSTETVGHAMELVGKENGIGNLLTEYKSVDRTSEFELQQRVEDKFKIIRRAIIESCLSLQSYSESSGKYQVILIGDVERIEGMKIFANLLSRMPNENSPQHVDRESELGKFDLKELTTLVRFTIRFKVEGSDEEFGREFVLDLPFTNFPGERDDAIVKSMVSDRKSLEYYVRLILDNNAGFKPPSGLVGDSKASGGGSSGQGELDDFTFLEPMLRAFSRDPKRFDRLQRAMERLSSTEDSAEGDIHLTELIGLWGMFKGAIDEESLGDSK